MDDPPPPNDASNKFRSLCAKRDMLLQQRADESAARNALIQRLAVADAVKTALEQLTDRLFADVTEVIEKQLTLALQEVLEQPLVLKVERGIRDGRTTLSFHVERDGQQEDILRGQGGSVANVLSVGLRLLAITTLPASEHQRFLVLDEQDCWLRPDLVPKLVKIVHAAGKALGFQVLMISHHDTRAFENFADKIYRFVPTIDGVDVKSTTSPTATDGDSEGRK
jgi:ABC-type glutathione transport system ATPase component